jgi:hypothetical protein
MPYSIEPDQIRIRFKKRDVELYETLQAMSEETKLSLSEVARRLLDFTVHRIEQLPAKQRQVFLKQWGRS